ncbi:MAG: rubrerythrin family protein [Duncaniella sp.]|nr:rubrerythrin family protein [Duncaniella sp.]MDE6497017.1 rubrerythrin family protein [Duncaniella sp.]
METKSIKGTKTEHNLLAAFAGESQARSRYTLFAQKAKEEGYEQIAKIFLITADQELSHAQMFFNRLEGGMVEINAAYPAGIVADTMTNLREAAAGEREEWSDLYASFAQIALDEGFKDVAMMFKNVAKVEIEHEKRYLRLLERLTTDTEFSTEEETEWQCMHCGYVHKGKSAPKRCPVCGKEQGYFERKAENY